MSFDLSSTPKQNKGLDSFGADNLTRSISTPNAGDIGPSLSHSQLEEKRKRITELKHRLQEKRMKDYISERSDHSEMSIHSRDSAGSGSHKRYGSLSKTGRSVVISNTSRSSSAVHEGGSNELSHRHPAADADEPIEEEEYAEEDENWNEEEAYLDEEIDPDDPYQINRVNEIPHENLKELYTQVVDELLDLQLEFEEKLAEAEDQAKADLEKQKEELEEER
mmetsp:Transcript_19447/g.29905  ORF Transcript_19447/g.29905 Transcript_19447/m.29905 type:complete len:222 (+) Transcript_19447:39-704(+)|eukprot:CAMPEP_0170494154 /NCGR_PEP_ID=MMETSP0208-20121228/14476_1 /TAXON_ID=197538 /ORGANISM="Strombidium inclinatum, Strain S3" /LENGTH=221 /DNA_ID=CAMNT_0010770167 /DNA_START=10 /DNA_END=675 /DNA_ORIENTATION=+